MNANVDTNINQFDQIEEAEKSTKIGALYRKFLAEVRVSHLNPSDLEVVTFMLRNEREVQEIHDKEGSQGQPEIVAAIEHFQNLIDLDLTRAAQILLSLSCESIEAVVVIMVMLKYASRVDDFNDTIGIDYLKHGLFNGLVGVIDKQFLKEAFAWGQEPAYNRYSLMVWEYSAVTFHKAKAKHKRKTAGMIKSVSQMVH